MPRRVFVAPVLNAMGPVVDSRHSDLLTDWGRVDAAVAGLFSDRLRQTLLDSAGRPAVLSWFPISWSGFRTNPVGRDFGWFTIYDHYLRRWGEELRRAGDGIYWMYNHPDASGVGNAWGLDWLQNCHYLQVLDRLLLQRHWFPGVVEIPTAEGHATHFLEQFFPFQLGNRNSRHVNWDNVEADGRRTRDVIQWADAPCDWSPYRPGWEDHQRPGRMNQYVFRLLDIKTRIMSFPEDEVVRAFDQARAGQDVVIAGYEHDFRDRSEAIRELFLAPISRVARDYPDVEVVNAPLQEAMIACTRAELGPQAGPSFGAEWGSDHLRIDSDVDLFGAVPYAALEESGTGRVLHLPLVVTGRRRWGVQTGLLPERFRLGVAGFAAGGRQGLKLFDVEPGRITAVNPGSLERTIPTSFSAR